MNETLEVKRCLSETKEVIFGCLFLFLSTAINAFYCFVIYKTRASISQSIQFQSYILANITVCHIFYSAAVHPIIAYGSFVDSDTFACSAMREATGFLGYVGFCCVFINYFYLNLNRYIACRYPLRYSTIMTKARVAVALIVSWVTAIATNSLRFFDDEIKLERGVIAFRKSSSHTFTVIYVICIFTVLFFNIKLWLLGQKLYRRELSVIASISRPGDTPNCSIKTLTKNRLKATFIAFVLTVKNVVLFFPYVLSLQLHAFGCTASICDSLQSAGGVILPLSGFFDALICVFVIKEARLYLKKKLCRSNSIRASNHSQDRSIASPESSKDEIPLGIIRTNCVS